MSRRRAIASTFVFLTAASLTSGVLIATRPALGASAAWTGDDLALACLWWCALLGSVWLAATTLACVAALARGRRRAAHRIARLAPPLARRVLQAALIGTWALVPTAADAAPRPAPITVHVDPHGRLTTETRKPMRATGPSATIRTTTTTTTVPSPAPLPTHLPRAVPPHVSHSAAPAAAPARGRMHVVRPGDNLWQIARAEVSRSGSSERSDDAQIASYWRRVIDANRTTLRSGDPSLIFPGEVVALPFPVR